MADKTAVELGLGVPQCLAVEVTDARGDRVPCVPVPVPEYAESGRGLRIVAAYVDRWGVDEAPADCKTVWAELEPGRVDR
ncbi:hypothetical protein AB0D14_18710 [Streptomyces sp. NPDC048484]|uniref:hypothetical protein n=1 Tax=Streptomyces sp. NPDC048484 TaxID=3155146 RepID=UPI00343E3E91